MTEASTEIALINPVSGEIVSEDDLRAVADCIEDARAYASHLSALKEHLTGILAEHSRKVGSKTFSLSGRTVVMSADKELVWDVEELVKLLELGLPEETYDKLVTAVVSYKVNASVANQIASANPEYAEVIERARTYQPKKQYASLRPINEVQR